MSLKSRPSTTVVLDGPATSPWHFFNLQTEGGSDSTMATGTTGQECPCFWGHDNATSGQPPLGSLKNVQGSRTVTSPPLRKMGAACSSGTSNRKRGKEKDVGHEKEQGQKMKSVGGVLGRSWLQNPQVPVTHSHPKAFRLHLRTNPDSSTSCVPCV